MSRALPTQGIFLTFLEIHPHPQNPFLGVGDVPGRNTGTCFPLYLHAPVSHPILHLSAVPQPAGTEEVVVSGLPSRGENRQNRHPRTLCEQKRIHLTLRKHRVLCHSLFQHIDLG